MTALGHSATAAEFDVVATRKVQLTLGLLLIQPPRHVHVHGRGTVSIMGRHVFHDGKLSQQVRAHGVHNVLTYQAASITYAVGMSVALRVQHNSCRLTGTGGKDDHTGTHMVLLTGYAINEANTIRLSLSIAAHLKHHGIRANGEVACCQSWG